MVKKIMLGLVAVLLLLSVPPVVLGECNQTYNLEEHNVSGVTIKNGTIVENCAIDNTDLVLPVTIVISLFALVLLLVACMILVKRLGQ